MALINVWIIERAYLCTMEIKSRINQAYKELVLSTGQFPVSIQKVCELAEIGRSEFNQLFENLNEVQQSIWQSYFFDTIRTIEASELYQDYMVREKLLAFYYTLLEVLKTDRKFLELFKEKLGVWNYNPKFLELFKPVYLAYVTELVEEGKARGEIAERYVIGGDYAGWHWPQCLFLLSYWLKDSSENAERTDQAIDKAVNFGFDFMGPNLMDSAFDLAKFLLVRPKG